MERDLQKDNSNKPKTKRSYFLLYLGGVLILIILVMSYFAFFAKDDNANIGRIKDVNQSDTTLSLAKNENLNDDQVKEVLVKFINAYYYDQHKGYFDPPSYFAVTTETFYNYHNLNYQRLREAYYNRKIERENEEYNWVPTSLEFTRQDNQIVATYWISESFYSPTMHEEHSGDTKIEVIVDEKVKIISLREVETKNLKVVKVTPQIDSIAKLRDQAIIDSIKSKNLTLSERILESGDNAIFEELDLDKSPEFNGDASAYENFVKSLACFQKDKIKDKIILQFIVEKNGKLTNVQITKGNNNCDNELIHLLGAGPTWKPGIKDGKAVRSLMIVTVNVK